MSHACHRFWKCYKTLTFCSLLRRCTTPCACHAKAHLNVQKCSVSVRFLHFWLQNVLRATMACAFSTSQLLKVVRRWCVLYILTSKCASRHNGVQFFISHLARWLRTRRFSEPTFRPSRATNHWKNTVFRDFPTFSRICVFFLLTLSLLWSSLFYSSLLSDSSHLCFSSVHIVGSLTSKLPSVNIIICTVYMPMFCISSMVLFTMFNLKKSVSFGPLPRRDSPSFAPQGPAGNDDWPWL